MLVQLEPIGTAAIRAANAVGLVGRCREPHYDRFMTPEPPQRQPAPGRQEDEQPPDEHSLDESRKRGVVRRIADVSVHIVAAVIENLTP